MSKIILTCEHADFKVPKALRNIPISKSDLKSHKGWDAHALSLCQAISKAKNIKYHQFTITRLLIDANRRLHVFLNRPQTKKMSKNQTRLLIKAYQTYRQQITKDLEKKIKAKNTTYLFSIHSFTPIYKAKKRITDIGILFRPEQKKEAQLALRFKRFLKKHPKTKYLHIHFNRPYRGNTDCFFNDLMDKYGKQKYLQGGLFLEFNQSLLKKQGRQMEQAMNEFFREL